MIVAWGMPSERKNRREDGFDLGAKKGSTRGKFQLGGNLAFGEYTLALRLTSKLVDLRAGYANPIPLRLRSRSRFAVRMPKKAHREGGLFWHPQQESNL